MRILGHQIHQFIVLFLVEHDLAMIKSSDEIALFDVWSGAFLSLLLSDLNISLLLVFRTSLLDGKVFRASRGESTTYRGFWGSRGHGC